MIATANICLTDSPVVVRLKRKFAVCDDREQLLREWIALRHGDIEAHFAELDILRWEKLMLSERIFEHSGRTVGVW
jgi:hypothetical protein